LKANKTTHSVSRWVLLAGLMLPLAAPAATVTGTVTNKTTGRPDASDPVVLLSLAQGMQEVASVKPDAQGHFSINVPDSSMHLIRVDHQQASYYEAVPPGATHVNVTVYDAAAKVPGVRTEADVLRMETDSQGLHVIENYFVENNSKPPKTQFSSEAYPIYLPPDAQIQGAQAEGPNGMPVSISPEPLAGKGHYAFVFPLRPGETRFGISYLIPYKGSMTFHAKVSLPTGNYAVMLPNSMTFQSPGASGFEQIQDNKVKAQTFVAKNAAPGQDLTFTVSGTGSMPRELQAQTANQSQADAGASQNDRPGGGLGQPIDTPGPLHKYRWWIVSALGLVLVVVAAFLLGGKKSEPGAESEAEESALTPTAGFNGGAGGTAAASVAGSNASRPAQPAASASGTPAKSAAPGGTLAPTLLNALKEELFNVETERVEGRLTDAQYAEIKGALEIVLRRALGRKS
jgi:hypothetical protein